MPPIGPTELIIILIIALVIFGPGKLSDIGGSLGKSMREFKKGIQEINEEASLEIDDKPSKAVVAKEARKEAKEAVEDNAEVKQDA